MREEAVSNYLYHVCLQIENTGDRIHLPLRYQGESWCDNNCNIQCNNGILDIKDCENINLECVNGEYTDIENNEDDIDELDTKPIEDKEGCFGGSSALLLILPFFMIRRRKQSDIKTEPLMEILQYSRIHIGKINNES